MGTNTSKHATEESTEGKKSPADSESLSNPKPSTTKTSVVSSKNEPKPNLSGMTSALHQLFLSIPHGFISIRRLPEDIFKVIFKYLSIPESSVANTIFRIADKKLRGTETFFKSSLDEAKLALPLLQAVISGNLGANPEEENEHSLMNLVRKDPAALFMKGDVSFPNGCDVYLLPTIPEDLSKYKGHYIWANQQQLVYVHYDGTSENVPLDNARQFNQAIQSLPKERLSNEDSVALTNAQIKQLMIQHSSNQHKPIPHQRFYDVSPFQLMQFFCDDDMQKHIMPLIPPAFQATMNTQLKELGAPGAADIIKVNRNPLDPNFKFEDILHYKASYIVGYDDNDAPIRPEVTHPLLEKPKGLIYYKDSANQVHWYRADVSTQSIEPIDNPLDHPDKKNDFSQKDQQDFSAMVSDIDQMEDMSSKQSSQGMRRLISKILKLNLHQEGINFELEGIPFKSGCYDFNRQDNAYRKCHRLYTASKWSEGDKIWCEELGHRQKECSWKLQRLCEENRPENYKSTVFRRGFNVGNCLAGGRIEKLLTTFRQFVRGLGSLFAIHKGGGAAGSRALGELGSRSCALDLVAGNRLVEDAKANMIRRDDLIPSGPDISVRP